MRTARFHVSMRLAKPDEVGEQEKLGPAAELPATTAANRAAAPSCQDPRAFPLPVALWPERVPTAPRCTGEVWAAGEPNAIVRLR
jgi:hypothetical protein